MQVFCIGLTVLIAFNELTRINQRMPTHGVAWYGVFADWATILASIGTIVLIRRGHIRRGYVLLLSSFVGILAGSLALRGLTYHRYIIVRTYAVLLVLPALLLGRRALWTSLSVIFAAMFVGHLRDTEGFGGSGPLAPPEPPLGVWGQAAVVM